jgi:hypothetical protein
MNKKQANLKIDILARQIMTMANAHGIEAIVIHTDPKDEDDATVHVNASEFFIAGAIDAMMDGRPVVMANLVVRLTP